MNPVYDRKRVVIFIGVTVAVLSLIILFITILSGVFSKNPYGDSVTISNYGQKIKNLPKDYENLITSMLYDMVRHNSSENIKLTTIGNAVIRSGSDTQEASNGRVTGLFIVDLESIKQSYRVQYEFSIDPNNDTISGYPLLVSCLEKDELIYGNFDCKEVNSDLSQEDPIIGLLPYTTLTYEIKGTLNDSETVSLQVTVFLSSADYKTGVDAAIEQRKQQVEAWIHSQNLDPTNYSITYSY